MPPAPFKTKLQYLEASNVAFLSSLESNYLNDLWAFDSFTLQWTQLHTVGEIPQPRSHSTLNLHTDSQNLVLFGGGSTNKERFNTIHTLNWITKQWKLIPIPQNQNSPEPRTYHSAEVIANFLVIFGGEGIQDLGDLWIFDLESHQWTEIDFFEQDIKPEARRFHASCKTDNELIIIGGCKGKYKIVKDIYILNFDRFIKTKNPEHLIWKSVEIAANSYLLQRWGHSVSYNVENKKAYIFGGRTSTGDINSLVQLNLNVQKVVAKNMDAYSRPLPRRRHSANFVGDSLVIFGGYNSAYFNDIHSIEISSDQNQNDEDLNELTNQIKLKYESKSDLMSPIQLIELNTLFYNPDHSENWGFAQKSNVPGILILKEQHYLNYSKDRGVIQQKDPFNPQLSHFKSIADNKIHQKILKNIKSEKITVQINGPYNIFVDSSIRDKNAYFQNFTTQQGKISLDFLTYFEDIQIMKTFLLCIQEGILVVPKSFCLEDWIKLLKLSDYFCAKNLYEIIEKFFVQKIQCIDDQIIMHFVQNYDLPNLLERFSEKVINNHFTGFSQNQDENELEEDKKIKKFEELEAEILKTVSDDSRYSKFVSEGILKSWMKGRFSRLVKLIKKGEAYMKQTKWMYGVKKW